MKVTLNIENDAELRASIKDCIKGQVLSVVREELLEIVKKELERKIKGLSTYAFDNMVQTAIKEAISNILYKNHNVLEWDQSFIQPYVNKKLDTVLKNKNWDDLVNVLAKEKVRSLIN